MLLTLFVFPSEFLAFVNSRRVRIPNDRWLRNQFVSLERRTSRSGRDTVDHPVNGFDDLANASAGALVLASASARIPREPHIEIVQIPRVGLRDNEGFWHKLSD